MTLKSAMRNSTKTELQDEVRRLRHRVQELEKQQTRKSGLASSAVNSNTENTTAPWVNNSNLPLLDVLPCGILECHPSGLIRFGNERFLQMFGYSLETLQGRSIFDLIVNPEASAQGSSNLASQIHQRTTPLFWESSLYTGDGRTKAARINWSCERDQSGQVIACFAVVNELSELKRVSKPRRDRSRDLFNLADEMILALDADETVSQINLRGAALLEQDEAEIIGKNWFDHFLPASEREQVRTLFRQLIRGEVKPVEYYENEVLTANGQLKSMAWHNTILRNDDGSIVGTLSMGVDITGRKETQQVLRENLQMFRQIFEHIQEMFWVSSPDLSKIYYTSPMYEEIWGRSCQSMYDDADSWLDAVHPEDRAMVAQEFQRKSAGDFSRPEFPEFRVIHTDGTVRWILARAFPVLNEANEITRVVGLNEDITRRKQNQEAVKKANAELERRVDERTSQLARKTAQLKAVFNAIPDVVLVINNKGTIVNCNSRHNKNTFVSHKLSLGKKIWKVLPERVGQQFAEAIQAVTRTRQMKTIDYSLMLEGEAIWYRARVLPYQSEELLVIIEYIHDQKLAEIELKHTHEKLSEAQMLAHIGSWEWDFKNDVLWCSDEVFRIFGVSQSEFKPKYASFLKRILPDDQKIVKQVVERAIKHDIPFNIEHRIIRINGEIRHVQDQGVLKKNEQGEGVHLHGTVQDVTERYETARKAQEYRDILAHSSRLALMGELTAGISHELNQPLTAIANYSSVMNEQIKQGQDVSELVNRIEELSLRSGKIVKRLKSLAERRAQERNLFDLQDSIRNTLLLIKYEIRQKQVEVNIRCHAKHTMVFANRVQIEQVLANLFLNAVEAMAEAIFPRILTITVSTAKESMTLVTVQDTGKGVPAYFVGQLFTPFTSNKKDGLGIGLSLSRSLVEASGGKIGYVPATPGGATFQITLPTSPPQ